MNDSQRQAVVFSRRILTATLLGVVACVATPSRAAAQTPAIGTVSRVGSTVGFGPSFGTIRGTDVAYDPVNNVYLMVEGNGTLLGTFLLPSGSPAGATFGITNGSSFGAFPRVCYSPDANNGSGGKGAFLVTWDQDDAAAAGNFVHVTTVAFSATGGKVVGLDHAISDGSHGGAWFEAGAAVAYSKTSQRFMVAWQTGDFSIHTIFLDPNGNAIGVITAIASPGTSRDPGVAWNPANNLFGVSMSRFDNDAHVEFRTVDASLVLGSTGSFLAKADFGDTASGTFNTGVDVSALNNQFVVGWGTANGSSVASFDQSGNMIGTGILSTDLGGSDNFSLAYNATSGTFLAVGQITGSSLLVGAEIIGAELNGGGVPISAGKILTNGGQANAGSFYPRVAALGSGKQWDVVYSRNFSEFADQVVATTSANGGSTTALSAASTPPATTTTPVVTTPVVSACPSVQPVSTWVCVNGGWVPPTTTAVVTTPVVTTPVVTTPVVTPPVVTTPVVTAPATTLSTASCTGTAPVSTWLCVNGGWVPSDSKVGIAALAAAGVTTTTPVVTTPVVTTPVVTTPVVTAPVTTLPTTSCAGNAPVSTWLCVNGGWVPDTSAIGIAALAAANAGSTTTTTTTPTTPTTPVTTTPTSTASCPGADPFVAIFGRASLCVNGGWVPNTGG